MSCLSRKWEYRVGRDLLVIVGSLYPQVLHSVKFIPTSVENIQKRNIEGSNKQNLNLLSTGNYLYSIYWVL